MNFDKPPQNKIENQENNYLSFTRLRQQDVSDYFTDWISILQLESSTEYTNQLYSIINSLPLPHNNETNERYSIDEVRNMVYENARNNATQTINLRTLSQQIYGSENTIIVYFEENNISIDSEFRFDKRALKKFKRKFEKTGVIRELRDRKTFEKPSVKRRDEIKKAIYVKHLQINEE